MEKSEENPTVADKDSTPRRDSCHDSLRSTWRALPPKQRVPDSIDHDATQPKLRHSPKKVTSATGTLQSTRLELGI